MNNLHIWEFHFSCHFISLYLVDESWDWILDLGFGHFIIIYNQYWETLSCIYVYSISLNLFLWILSVVWTYFPFYSLNVSIQVIVNYRPFLCISEWFRQCCTRLFQWINIISKLINSLWWQLFGQIDYYWTFEYVYYLTLLFINKAVLLIHLSVCMYVCENAWLAFI